MKALTKRLALFAFALLAALGGCSHQTGPDLARGEAASTQLVELQVGGLQRHLHVYSPPGLQAVSPLLIAFHPSASSGARMRAMAGATLERMARAHGFLVAYPDGFEGYFDDCRRQAPYRAHTEHIDDVAFSRAIVARLKADYAIDERRVYVLGYSNGGQMALRLALEAPELVAGVVSIAANVPTSENLECQVREGPRPSVVLIEGTSDPINPYKGGSVSFLGLGYRGKVLSAQDSAQWFARRYGLDPEAGSQPAIAYKDLSARIQIWGSAAPRVELISIEGGGHTIPVPEFPNLFVLGRTFADSLLLEKAWAALQPE